MLRAFGLACLLALGGCATTQSASADHPEARLYDAALDANAAVDSALARALQRNVNVMIVMGANWCHDSRAFAGWSKTPRIGGLLKDRFELVFVNVGMPQTKDGHNLDIAARYELDELVGTPTILIIAPDGKGNGKLLNRDTAKSWRNAASRTEDAIYDELNGISLPLSLPLSLPGPQPGNGTPDS